MLRLTFDEPVRIAEIGLIPGYAKLDPATGKDRFMENRVVTQVRYRFDDGAAVTAFFEEAPRVRFTATDTITRGITIEILGTTAHGGRDFTAISEIEVRGDTALAG